MDKHLVAVGAVDKPLVAVGAVDKPLVAVGAVDKPLTGEEDMQMEGNFVQVVGRQLADIAVVDKIWLYFLKITVK